jgi:hypothetical protein
MSSIQVRWFYKLFNKENKDFKDKIMIKVKKVYIMETVLQVNNFKLIMPAVLIQYSTDLIVNSNIEYIFIFFC